MPAYSEVAILLRTCCLIGVAVLCLPAPAFAQRQDDLWLIGGDGERAVLASELFSPSATSAGPAADGPWATGPYSQPAPLGPGSAQPEAPHRRFARFVGQGLVDWFRRPPVVDRDRFEPELCESWLYRPYSASAMAGVMGGTELIDNWVEQRQGYLAGYRLGVDVDDFWGFETRIGYGFVRLDDSPLAEAAQQAADDAAGLSADDPYRRRFDDDREADFFLWDVNLLYYPRGDAAVRPYAMIGFGVMKVSFVDRLSGPLDDMMLAVPLAIGLKHRWTESAAVRLEIADNLAFGDPLETLHEVSLTAGVEIRFGGTRRAYWPWNPARHYW